MAFAPNGKMLATASSDGTLKLWDIQAHSELATLRAFKLAGTSVGFSADGKRLVTGSSDGPIKLWDIATKQEVLTIEHAPPPGHPSWDTQARFAANGNVIVARAMSKNWQLFWPPSFSEINGLQSANSVTAPKFPVALTPNPVQLAQRIPPRSAQARAELLDLSGFYNAVLSQDWHGPREGNDLASLPQGLQSFAGTDFDVRGIVQLSSQVLSGPILEFPEKVEGIPVHRECRALYFLHASGGSANRLEGTLLGKYVVHFANGEQQEIPIAYGLDVRDWWIESNEPTTTCRSVIAWRGSNPQAKHGIRLFKSAWTNATTQIKIDTLDYVSSHGTSAPFLIAITAE